MSEENTSYPEHDKLAKIKDLSQTVGEFLEAMQARGIWLCKFREGGNTGEMRYLDSEGRPTNTDRFNHTLNPEYSSWGDAYIPIQSGRLELLAEHFGIDTRALEAEKCAMLDKIRTKAETP